MTQESALHLGEDLDDAGERNGRRTEVEPGHLTTHGVILGMTGSGKTGLGIVLLEEALSRGIPALILEPKGDMGNLLLNFPSLRPEDFRPWIDEGEASREDSRRTSWQRRQRTRGAEGSRTGIPHRMRCDGSAWPRGLPSSRPDPRRAFRSMSSVRCVRRMRDWTTNRARMRSRASRRGCSR